MRKLLILFLISATASLSMSCIATRKFARNEVKTASDTINARVDTTDAEVRETQDSVDQVNQRVTSVDGRVTSVDGRVTDLDTRVKTEIASVDQKAVQANSAAERANTALGMLDQQFQSRNQYTVQSEQAVQFNFDSSRLEDSYKTMLDETAQTLISNPDAIVILEGRTDSVGNQEYNVKLGEARVESVKRYLAVEKAVPVYKIHQISLGAARPIASNDSRDGREKNRAVTIMVLVPQTDRTAVTSR